MYAFHHGIPVVMKKNVQKIRMKSIFKDGGAADPTEHAGKELMIKSVEFSDRIPFVRLNGKRSVLMVVENHPAHRKIALSELMIPIEAIDPARNFEIPKPKPEKRRKPAAKRKIAVWWISQGDCMVVGHLKKTMPKYIRSEYRSRYGAPGRQRLWVAPCFGHVDLSNESSERFGAISIDAAGIVIWRKHVKHVINLPGVVTDHKIVPIIGFKKIPKKS